MKHFKLKNCLKNATWNKETLECPCGRKIAIRYMINNEMRLFCYGGFVRYKEEIIKRKDTKKITDRSDLFGNVDDKEWDKIFCNI